MRTIQRTLWEILVPTIMDGKPVRTNYIGSASVDFRPEQ